MLQKIILQHFRNYSQKQFDFHEGLTVVVGPNTAGKTNLCEAIMLLATGKSFRAGKDTEMIAFGEEVARIQGLIVSRHSGEVAEGADARIPTRPRNDSGQARLADALAKRARMTNNVGDNLKLEVTVAQGEVTGGRFLKRFQVNGVGRSRNNFIGNLPAVLFRPEELEIVIDGPSLRRNFLDTVLEQVDSMYRTARTQYDRALRQRNALIDVVRESGKRNAEQFAYWDDLLITHGNVITQKREEFLSFVNAEEHTIFPIRTVYDKSIMSSQRLLAYQDAEIGAGVTLVGPQRDDFQIFSSDNDFNVQQFGSRGQQRLAVLQLKLLQLTFIEKSLHVPPLLVLDDIFSELDSRHIDLVLSHVQKSQVILTTTHGEFVKKTDSVGNVIKLEK